MSESQKKQQLDSLTLFQKLPTVNFTHLQEHSRTTYKSKGLEEPYKLFPRWIAQATLINPETRANTSAHLIAGD